MNCEPLASTGSSKSSSHNAGLGCQPHPQALDADLGRGHAPCMLPPVGAGQSSRIRGKNMSLVFREISGGVMENDFLGDCKCHNAKSLNEKSKIGLPYDAAIPLLSIEKN